ncbi:MAG TPA: cupredoxin domain-containing protein [Vicinamibacterales bacterium]|nr:cupredoxin domain-containing protein [Vicinamibacterales bacterium]
MRATIIQCVLAIAATVGLAVAQAPRHAVAAPPIHQITVVARKFQFEPAELVVSPGEPVRLTIHSEDVVHGFGIPKMNIDVRVPAGGESVTIEFIAPEPGRYEIVCSKFCGHGHAEMKAMLVSRENAV